MSYRVKVLLKVIVTIGLVLFLAYQMDLRKFVAILSSASPMLILLATLVHIASVFLLVVRWQAILRKFDIVIEVLPLTKITFIGYFFNLFLPSGIGGDFFRAYYLSKREKRGMSTTLTTTVLERSAGMFALLVIGTVFALVGGIAFQKVPLVFVFMLIMAVYLLGNFVLFNSWLHRQITAFLRKRELKQWEEKMELVYKGLNTLRRDRRTVSVAIVLSLGIQFLASVTVWVAAIAIGIDAPFVIFLTFVPLINLSIMIPLTINGIGLRESLFYLLFAEIGLSVETSVTLSLVTFIVYVLTAVPGAIIYSMYKKEEQLGAMLVKAEPS